LFATVAEHETVPVPEPVTLAGAIAPHARPEGTVSVKVTTPVNPFTAVTVMVDVADEPALTAAGEDALIVKSGAAPKVKVAVAEWDSDPLVPVTVTVKVPVVVDVQDRVAVPEPVTLVELIGLQVSPEGTVSVRPTEPAKPPMPVTVIVEVRLDPAVPDGEVAAIVKSWNWNVAVVEWVREPLVPVMERAYVFATVALHDTVAVPEPVTELGVIEPQVKPVGAESVRLTMPVNPFNAVTVIVEVAETPTSTAAGDVAVIEKSGAKLTVNVAVALWVRDPLVPVTVTEYVFAVLELHERLAVPEPEIVLGEIGLQVRPVGIVSVRVTVPEKLLTAVTVMVEVAEAPTVAEGEVAAIVKSTKLNVAVAVCTREPLVPVIMSA
jgi:hypothetical protein